MYKIKEVEMVVCPYNRSHIVSKFRIQRHIMRCKKNYPNVELAICFYNYSHRLHPEDMLAHYKVCTHKTKLEGARYCDSPELNLTSPSVNSKHQLPKFPDITVEAKFFSENGLLSTKSNSLKWRGNENSDSDSEDCERNPFQFSNSDSSDEELEPLPLPVTVSKAFVCTKQQPTAKKQQASDEIDSPKVVGRGKQILSSLPPNSAKTILNSPQALFNKAKFTSKINKSSGFSQDSVDESYTESIVSSMFNDLTTFKSEDIIFQDNYKTENKNNFDVNFNKFNKM